MIKCEVCGFGGFANFSYYRQCVKCGVIYRDNKIITELCPIDAIEKYKPEWLGGVRMICPKCNEIMEPTGY